MVKAKSGLIMLERFYEIISRLNQFPGQGSPLRDAINSPFIPERGVYFFCENGEYRKSGAKRIVRVGTHALKDRSKSSLKSRLKAHLGNSDGNGNHRGSIFRLHVGSAIQNQSGNILHTWGGSKAPEIVKQNPNCASAERELEKHVSQIIGSMPVFWLAVSDPAGPTSARGFIERYSIGLLSGFGTSQDPASKDWLGKHSGNNLICCSGLWNVNHVGEEYRDNFDELLTSAFLETQNLFK